MRYKRRYIILRITGVSSQDEFSNSVYSTINKFYPLLVIRANVKIIKDVYSISDDAYTGIISVNNRYKYDVIFTLSLMKRVFSRDVLTLGISGTLKRTKKRLNTYGSDAK